ncbi:MAG: fumarylacetoacetate hydrolase family protein [Pseudomonadota bacterium]
MRIVRYGAFGDERPGMLDDAGVLRDLSGHVPDIAGDTLSPAGLSHLAQLDPGTLPEVSGEQRLGACVGGVGKFMCIGLNYTDHAAELGLDAPAHPVLFLKATSAICGPDDPVVMPRGSSKTDWECELGIVIGQAAKYVSVDDALSHVAGYCVINDLSERDFQMELSGQWTKGKSCDGFGPIGPWLVTRDAVADVQDLRLTVDVNGQRMQDGHTGTMIFSVAEIVSHLSTLFTLHPGDVIATGTPPGVGMGQKPAPVYLREGDTLRVEISGLGVQTKTVLSESAG